jgi:hypothetical protein
MASQYKITIAEFATGYVLDHSGKRKLKGGHDKQGHQQLAFDTFAEARAFADEYVMAHPEHECVVEDETGEICHAARPPLVELRRITRKPWWKFW